MSGNVGISFDDGIKVTSTATPNVSINFRTPLRGMGDMLLEIVTLSAVSSGPYVDVQYVDVQRFRAP